MPHAFTPCPPNRGKAKQLKQNLWFHLRAANKFQGFYVVLNGNGRTITYSTPPDYAYSGFYDPPEVNEFLPFDLNYVYRNFVADPNRFDNNAILTNGISYDFLQGITYNYLDESVAPYHFQPPTNVVSISPLLSPTESTFLWDVSLDGFGVTLDTQTFDYIMAPAVSNIFGLNYVSIREYYNSGTEYLDLHPGQSIPFQGASQLYPQTAQPILHTVDYYFGRPGIDPLPGSEDFSPTNATPPLIVSGNDPFHTFDEFNTHPFHVAGYAKQSIDNGDPNKFAYLGLYFDKAYKVNLDGTISTNETGILSEYGEFFPTEPGRVVLTTKPESVGETNIGGCIVHTIKLELDVNHDGTIDRTITGQDNTSYSKPFVFWVNNDRDIISPYGDIYTPGRADSDDSEIKSTRDLEDFARLWISGVPSLPSSEGYSATLNWRDASGPAIRIYNSIENDGSMAYLTNGTTASNVVSSSYRFALGTVSNSSAYTFPADYFDGTRKHFIFEGATAGTGELMLTITKNGTPVASTSVYIELKDITDMYERVHIDNVITEFPAMRTSTATSTFSTNALVPSADESKQVIVSLHGFNNDEWRAANYSQTMFKRLYWQGYQGRFAALRWPTLLNALNYNRAEYVAFRSAGGTSAYFNSLRSRFPDYSINAVAHSMGNIVMMETLKLQLAASSNAINNYILMEAAVPAHCYDTNAALCPGLFTEELEHPTPNTYLGYPGAITNALRGKMFNFFNTNDFALKVWVGDQLLRKPDGGSGYIVDPNLDPFLLPNTLITDPREIMAFCARPRSFAIGAQPGVNGAIQGAEVDLHVQFGFEDGVEDHSGQYTRNIQQLRGFYSTLLQKCSEE